MHVYTLSDSYISLERRHHMSSNKVKIEKGWVLWFQCVKDRFVFHTLEPENPTFLMTAPAEKPSLKVKIHYHYIPLEEATYRGVHTFHTGERDRRVTGNDSAIRKMTNLTLHTNKVHRQIQQQLLWV